MAYATAKQISESDIPVIDFAPVFADGPSGYEQVAGEMRKAAEANGFFYIKNHGVADEVIAQTQSIAHEFFASRQEEKLTVAMSGGGHRGFLRIGEAKMYENALSDLKESYVWGLDIADDDPEYLAGSILAPNAWPGFLPQMRPTLNTFFEATHVCGRHLLRAFATSLGLPLDHFVGSFDKPVSRGSLVYYPPQPSDLSVQQFGVASHTDYGCLTMVYQDAVGGLQVATRAGEWVTALPIEGTFVVNIGDLMARWSNNHFKSTPHRGGNSSGVTRQSVAMFIDPNAETTVVPVYENEKPLFDPVSVGDYIQSRYDASFEYRKKANA
ncbi:MAG: 2OG-Fe(II) oxygenase [Proteobacteria bacterium]|nr:2OG-Fe(II) oxygenase [Pseudomonadota bacterium]